MGKNVMIPQELFLQTINLLETWDISQYDLSTRYDYDNVLFALLKKRQSMELREAYAKVIYAPDENARHDARVRYLQQKRLNDEPF
jgi:hypothetical protein